MSADMSPKNGMFRVTRNLKICHGVRPCGLCLNSIPQLEYGGFTMAGWAIAANAGRIEQAVMDCPVGAISIDKVGE